MTKLPRKICLGIILCMLFVLTATCCIACTTVANARIDDSAIVGVAQDVYSNNENTATGEDTMVEDEASDVYYGMPSDGGPMWKLEDGVLEIIGFGKMIDYQSGEAPWYKHADKIQEVKIFFTYESIGAYAFYGCDNLRKVEISKSIFGSDEHEEGCLLTEIGAHAFDGCVNLETLLGFDAVENIDEYAFKNCVKLTGFNAVGEILLPESLESVGEGAFYNCDSIIEVVFPESFERVGNYAFYTCDNLFRIICPSSIDYIGYGAFARCYNMAEVELGNPNTDIKSNAFSYNGEWQITFMGYNDSTAEEYARNYGHKFFDIEFEDTLKVAKKSVSLDDRFAINYYVESDLIEGCHDTYLHVEKYSVDKDGNKTYVDGELIEEYTITNIAGKTYYVFTYSNIKAYELGSVLLTYIGTTEDEFDIVYWGNTEEYSIKEYAENMLEKYPNNVELRTLLVDMLNYGATSQIYFGYNVENLANADLTAEQQSYATKEMKEVAKMDGTLLLKDSKVELIGRSLALNERVEVNFYFDLKDYHTDDVYAVITYINCKGKTEHIVVDGKDFGGTDNRAKITLSTLNAREMRTQIEIQLYDAQTNESISHDYAYSIEQYVASALSKNIDANLRAMLEAMIKFGDSAEAYFG